jgi:hypothetical protein
MGMTHRLRLLIFATCALMCAMAQEEYGQQSSSAAPQAQTTPATEGISPHTHDKHGNPYVLPGEDEWTAQKRRLKEGSGGSRGRQSPYAPKKRKRKKSWLALMGVGGEDPDGKPKP